MTATLLRLLHLASPALPIGGFHFSQGLEQAVARGWVRDEASAAEWISGLAESVLGRLDLPILLRLWQGATSNDIPAMQRWNALLIAARETSELRAEDLHMGSALAKLLLEHQLSFPYAHVPRPAYATAFAFGCSQWHVSAHETLGAYAWTWSENQVLAAVKLVPLGQSAGQRILHRLATTLPEVVGHALDFADDDIGVAALIPGICSALHETQYTRLFRS